MSFFRSLLAPRPRAGSLALVGAAPPALHVGPLLLAGEPPPPGSGRGPGLPAGAGRDERRAEQVGHAGAGVFQVPRLVARGLARGDQSPPGVAAGPRPDAQARPEARTAWTVSAEAGTRTSPVTTIWSAMALIRSAGGRSARRRTRRGGSGRAPRSRPASPGTPGRRCW